MSIYKPKELFSLLEKLGISPKKVLSQNFLIDGNIVSKIVKTADVTPKDLILEIGPGPGALTQALLEAQATVLAVEKDRILAQALHRFQSDYNNLEVFEEDILKFPIEKTLQNWLKRGDYSSAKVIANLPYHLTTPILAQLVTLYPTLSTLVVMVQEEVARRITAIPGNKNYSSFTVFLNFYSTPLYAFKVKSHCFYPKPSVESAVVVLKLKKPPSLEDKDRFFLMTRTAFEHRRKMIKSSLKSLYLPAEVEKALEGMQLNPLERPENLSLKDFLCLFKKLS